MKQLKKINILHTFMMSIMLAILLVLPITNMNAEAPSPLVLGIHPYLPSTEIEKRFTPLIHYLSRQLGVPMELSVSKDYETHIENIGNKIFDIAYIGPSSYVCSGIVNLAT